MCGENSSEDGSVKSLGEFKVIDAIRRWLPEPPAVVLQSIGDDCAVVRFGSTTLLASADAFVEGVHFRRGTATPSDIGWKAATAAISDIGAMGGVPLFNLVTLACPAETNIGFVREMYRGLQDAAALYGVSIVGGDMTKSADNAILLDVMVIGEAPGGRYLTRHGAHEGDVLVVTGTLGESAAGLHILESGSRLERAGMDPDHAKLVQAHCRPAARIEEAKWLAKQTGVRAMIDISDGLSQDAAHLTEKDNLGIRIEADALPASRKLEKYCAACGLDLATVQLTGGEDYELAVVVAPNVSDSLCDSFAERFDCPLTPVGRFSTDWNGVRVDGQQWTVRPPGGFNHFA